MPNTAPPAWLLGKHITTVSLSPVTIDPTTRVVTAGTAQSLQAVLREIRVRNEPETEEISASTSTIHNHELLADDWSLEIVEMMVSTTVSSVIHNFMNANDHGLAIFTRGAQSWNLFFTRGPVEENHTGRGARTVTATLLQWGVTSAANTLPTLYTTP